MRPRMIVIAGPPGSGKSSLFSPFRLGVDAFNADDRAARLNRGSYRGISPEVRRQVHQEFERFILSRIEVGRTFSFETTLRTAITFEQARIAQRRGFHTIMRYVALDDVQTNIKRIIGRAKAGGHSATPSVIRTTYDGSLRNLATALREFDSVRVYDNSAVGQRPALVLRTKHGRIIWRAPNLPVWLAPAVEGLPAG